MAGFHAESIPVVLTSLCLRFEPQSGAKATAFTRKGSWQFELSPDKKVLI